MADPKSQGKIVELYPNAQYTVSQTICTIETPEGKTKDLSMSHFWPVRTPRPCIEKLPASEPLLTG